MSYLFYLNDFLILFTKIKKGEKLDEEQKIITYSAPQFFRKTKNTNPNYSK